MLEPKRSWWFIKHLSATCHVDIVNFDGFNTCLDIIAVSPSDMLSLRFDLRTSEKLFHVTTAGIPKQKTYLTSWGLVCREALR